MLSDTMNNPNLPLSQDDDNILAPQRGKRELPVLLNTLFEATFFIKRCVAIDFRGKSFDLPYLLGTRPKLDMVLQLVKLKMNEIKRIHKKHERKARLCIWRVLMKSKSVYTQCSSTRSNRNI